MRGYPIQGNSLGAKREASGFERYITYLRRWRKAGYTTTILLGLTIFAILCPISFKAVDHLAEAATGTAQDSTLTFTATSTTASATLNATDINGATATSNNNEKIAFSISTNNVTGYELSIKSSSGTTLTNGVDTLNAIGTSGIALNTFSNNTWGYLPSYYNSTENTNNYYYPITTSDITLNKTNTANSSNSSDSYTIGLGFKANYNVSAGTYNATDPNTGTSSIVLSYIANPVSYSITYNKGNTEDTVTNMPYTSSTPANTQSGSVSATSITLSNTVPARTGYDFKGWCLGTVTTDSTAHTDTCNGTIYNPDGNGTNLTYGIDKTTANTTTIYAMWNIKTFTCKISYKLENADGSFGSTTVAINETKQYGSTCSWSRNADTTYQAASYTNNSITSNVDTTVSVMRNTFTCKIAAKYQNADGSYGTASNVVNSTLRYGQTCSWSRNADATYKAASYSTSISSNIDTMVSVDRNTFTCKIGAKYQGTDGNYGTASNVVNSTLRYGQTCSWSRAADTTYKAASYSSTITSNIDTTVSVARNTFTCSKRYRLQNADGTYPNTYTNATGETIPYGATCSYSQSYTDYQTQSTSATITSATTLSLDLPRNTYTLTVSAGTNTSSPTGSGTYRWGQTVTVGVTKATNVTCTTYATPTWTATAGTAPSAGVSSSYIMPKSNATVTAKSTASNVSQTITLSRGTGASKITIAGTDYTGTSVSLTCGTYNISGGFSSGYEFNGWSRANGVAVTSTSTLATTMTVTGAGTLTLTGKSSVPGYCATNGISRANCMQTMTASDCTTTAKTVTDSRDGSTYLVQKLSDNKCWMKDNLRLGSSSTISLDSTNTNLPSGTTWTLPKTGTVCFTSDSCTGTNGTSGTGYTVPAINSDYKNTTTTSYGSGSGKIGVYYNYCAASAGGFCVVSSASYSTSSTDSDICPKGWRMPTGGPDGEYKALYDAYSNWNDFKNALSTLLSGRFINGKVGVQGSNGYFWSSTLFLITARAYYLEMLSSQVYPNSLDYRYYGYSVRCILK